jgi:hypothetical protein
VRGAARAALLAAAIGALGAGPARAESRYSLRGDGEWFPSMRADARALGGAEAASSVPSLSGNPASLAFAERTTFYGTYDTEWIHTKETLPGPDPERKEYSGLVPNLALVFPLPGGLRLGTGLLVSRRRGGIVDQTATVDDGSGGTLEYRQEFEGRGSLLRVPALLAFDLGRAQVGAGVDLVLLSAKQRWQNDFSPALETLGFSDSEDTDETGLGGVALRAGARVPVARWLTVGAWGDVPSRLSGDRRLEGDRTTGGLVKLGVDVHIGPRWATGLELRPWPRLRLAADWVREQWDEADPLTVADEFVNVDRYAVGVEWSPPGGVGGLDWPLRGGYRTENLHVLDTNGREVQEHVLTLGSGFGIAGGRGDIDWCLEYGWRGEKDVSEFAESFVRFGVTLTGWEHWGRRQLPPEDDDW